MNYISILIASTLKTGQSSLLLPQLLKEQLVQLEKQEENNDQNQQKSQQISNAQITPPEFMQSDEDSPSTKPKLVLKKEDILEKTRKKLAYKCFSKSRKIKMANISSSYSSCDATKSLQLATRKSRITEKSLSKLLFASTELNNLSGAKNKLYSQLVLRHQTRYQETGGLDRFRNVIAPRNRGITSSEEILPTLHFGHQGISVKILQRLLIYNGYAISIDGVFGALTETAVKAFQNQRKIGADGIVGNNTWRALSQ